MLNAKYRSKSSGNLPKKAKQLFVENKSKLKQKEAKIMQTSALPTVHSLLRRHLRKGG
jgi:hypothetical protein